LLPRCTLNGMNDRHSRTGEFRKVAEHLYRYSSNAIYYARYRHGGKEIQKCTWISSIQGLVFHAPNLPQLPAPQLVGVRHPDTFKEATS
jgi:hypothetical protein